MQKMLFFKRKSSDIPLRTRPALTGNLNQLMTAALRELVESCKKARFKADVAAMSADPTLRKESSRISREFEVTESDGL